MVKSVSVIVTAGEGGPVAPEWELVYEVDTEEAKTYVGPSTHEDVAFLVDPRDLLQDVRYWAMGEVPARVMSEMVVNKATLLRLKIYIGKKPILWGLTSWPSIRIESWQHGSPGIILVLALVIGVVGTVWAFLAWLFKKVEEVDWGAVTATAGVGIILLIVLALASGGNK